MSWRSRGLVLFGLTLACPAAAQFDDAGVATPAADDAAVADASGDAPVEPPAVWQEPPYNGGVGAPSTDPIVLTVPAEPVLADDDAYGAHAKVERAAGPGEFAAGGTGSKVNAPLEELASTVQTVDSETMRQHNSNDVSTALTWLPGTIAQWTYGGFLTVQSRGFQAAILNDGRRDSRAMVAQSAPQAGILDLDRIELLKGPSSVLYGYGAVGGVVNLIRKRASNENAYELNLGVGTPGQYRLHGGAQGEIAKNLSYRTDVGVVSYKNFRGYQSLRSQASSVVRWTPTKRDTFNVRFSYSFDHYNNDVGIPIIPDPNNPSRSVVPYGVNYAARYDTKNDGISYRRMESEINYRHDFDKDTYFEARGAVVMDRYSYLASESLIYVPPTNGMNAQVQRDYLYFDRAWRPIYGSAELHSTQRTGSVEHQLVAGYSIDSFTGVSRRSNLDGATVAPVDFTYPVDNTGPVAHPTTALDHYRIATHSVYGFDHMKLTDDLILTGGVRFDMLRSRVHRQYVDRAGATTTNASGDLAPVNLKSDFRSTGQVGLVYHLLEPLYAYASYGTGFQPQFIFPSDPTSNKYHPETSQQFEGGLRARVDKKRHVFSADAAGFLIRKRNLLIQRNVDEYYTAGLAQSRGLDLTASYAAPAWVRFSGGYGFVDAVYKKYNAPDAVTGAPMANFSGNRIAMVPKHTGNVWTNFIYERLNIGVGARIVGHAYADDQNRFWMPNYAMFDASASFGTEHAMLMLTANNILNRTNYFNSVINSSNTQIQATPGPGRELMATLRLKM